jgi:solute carrier family 35, member F5
MQLFFGFVGLFNIVVCWPIGVILHFTGVERFELPSAGRVVAGLLVNVSDIKLRVFHISLIS